MIEATPVFMRCERNSDFVEASIQWVKHKISLLSFRSTPV
jgi:hypothetical protein